MPRYKIRNVGCDDITEKEFEFTDEQYYFLDKVFETSRDLIAIDLFMKDAIKNVKAFALEKIKLLGAENKA